MKRKLAVIGAAALVAGTLGACGHDHAGGGVPPAPPPTNTNVSATSQQFLNDYAKTASETNSPLAVNGGAFTITDTSETSAPISVDAN